MNSNRPSRSWPDASTSAPVHKALRNEIAYLRLDRISSGCGERPLSLCVTGNNCCARYSKRLRLLSIVNNTGRISICAGGVENSPNARSHCRVLDQPPFEPTKTPWLWCADWHSTSLTLPLQASSTSKAVLSAHGLRFNQNIVSSLRRHWEIPCFEPPAE